MSDMLKLQLDLGERSYPIYIGQSIFAQPDLLAQHIQHQQVMIVTNSTVAKWYLQPLKDALKGYEVQAVVLPDGERYKNLDTLNLIFDALLTHRHNRTTTLLALGGGVIGDICGFAAASYQRGVNFIQIPTTVLSQVDSSVGGKTGVNHALGKNMLGAFYQPKAVLIDTQTLHSLPAREISAGLAEIIKYGLIWDYDFFVWLENNITKLLALEQSALMYAIETSCTIKAKVVAEDEKESGVRALLNLGHTFAHAIETHQGYGNWLHGEAVGAGMVQAAQLSQRFAYIREHDVKRITDLIQAAKLPIKGPENMFAEDYLQLMKVDKKVLDGQLRLILLDAIGRAHVSAKASDKDIIQLLQSI